MNTKNNVIVQVSEESKKLISEIQGQINQEVAATMGNSVGRMEKSIRTLSETTTEISDTLQDLEPNIQKLTKSLENNRVGQACEHLEESVSVLREKSVCIQEKLEILGQTVTNIAGSVNENEVMLSQIIANIELLQQSVIQNGNAAQEMHNEMMDALTKQFVEQQEEAEKKLGLLMNELEYLRLPFYKKWFRRRKK